MCYTLGAAPGRRRESSKRAGRVGGGGWEWGWMDGWGGDGERAPAGCSLRSGPAGASRAEQGSLTLYYRDIHSVGHQRRGSVHEHTRGRDHAGITAPRPARVAARSRRAAGCACRGQGGLARRAAADCGDAPAGAYGSGGAGRRQAAARVGTATEAGRAGCGSVQGYERREASSARRSRVRGPGD